MPEDEAVHQLCEDFRLKNITSTDAAGSQWLVQDGSKVVATVYFLAGRLVSISKDWMAAGEPDSEVGFVDALYVAVKNYEQKGHVPCEVRTKTWQDASGETKTVYVTCKGQQTHLEIDLNRVHGYEDDAQFSEVLAYPEQVISRLAKLDANYARATEACEQKPIPPVRLVAPVVPQRGILSPPSPPVIESGRETPSHAATTAKRPTESIVPVASGEKGLEFADLANPSELVTVSPGKPLSDDMLSATTAHNRALCDQTITVAGLTPRGLDPEDYIQKCVEAFERFDLPEEIQEQNRDRRELFSDLQHMWDSIGKHLQERNTRKPRSKP
jgi:hypothetical protein